MNKFTKKLKNDTNLVLLFFLRMQKQAASPITAVKPPQTAINKISNIGSLFVSMPLGLWPLLPGTLKGFGSLCVLVTGPVVGAGEDATIIVVDTIDLVEYSTLGEDFRFVDPVATKDFTIV